MIILEKPVTRAELIELAENFYGDMVKGVVDIDKELLALDAEDEEIREKIRIIVNKYTEG